MKMNNTKSGILIVDDEPHMIAALKRVFLDDPYRIYGAEDSIKAMEILSAHPIKVVISDEKMPGILGSEFLAVVARRFPNIIRIMLTGHGDIDVARKAINEGEIHKLFLKPCENSEFRMAVRDAVQKYDLEEERRLSGNN
jgi:two-component system, probable response regulator PhcQ